ncbi:MAG TPA: prepilin-type N-terminal cleavage/methylation domain-containing protein [Candidatus Methylomirabilis sp.]
MVVQPIRVDASLADGLPARRERPGWEGRLATPWWRGRGMTIIELVVVIAIVGGLATLAIPRFLDARQKAANIKAIGDISILQREIDGHAALNDERVPMTLSEIGRGVLRDPWGNPYQFLNFADVKGKGKGEMRKDRFVVPLNTTYDLYSMGPDGKTTAPLTSKAGRDDIVRANNGAFIGLASEY